MLRHFIGVRNLFGQRLHHFGFVMLLTVLDYMDCAYTSFGIYQLER